MTSDQLSPLTAAPARQAELATALAGLAAGGLLLLRSTEGGQLLISAHAGASLPGERLFITNVRRAAALGLTGEGEVLAFTADADGASGDVRPVPALAAEALGLAKQAGIIPALYAAVPAGTEVSASVLALPLIAGVSVFRAEEARLPVRGADGAADARIVLFRDTADPRREHSALVIGDVSADAVPLVRLHSKCLTGDIFGSRRCDCGEQLAVAKAQIIASGCGVLVYLDQEGRGIGLQNKLTAYNLQDEGFDTFEANHQLGFESDERHFAIGTEILKQLGVRRVRLLTNNPEKLAQFSPDGIEVTERVAIGADATKDSAAYLDAKRAAGHLL